MGFVESILLLVQALVNDIFGALNGFFAILGIDVFLDPINLGRDDPA